MNLKKIVKVFAVTALLIGVLSGCGNSSEDKQTSSDAVSPEKNQLNVATELFSYSLDPAVDYESWFVMRWGTGETLVKFADDYSFEPWLAESWNIADDNLTWTFVLKDGVKFSNGEDMTASKVVASIEKIYKDTDPANGGTGNPQGFFTYSSLSADDEANTVTIVTTKPTPDLPGCMAYPWMMITNVDESRNLATEGPIATGPYVIESMRADADIKLVKNEFYWDGEVPFETVSILKVQEPSTRSMSLQDGSADMAMSISAADRETLANLGDYNISSVSGSRVGYAHVNLDGVLSNDTLRHAITMAIDGKTIADITTNGSYTYGYAVIPSILDFDYDKLSFKYHFDEAKATKLLDDAGIVDTDGDGIRELDGKNIVLDYKVTASRQMNTVAEAQATQLQKIGIGVNVSITETQADVLINGDFDLAASNEVTTPTGDPSQFLNHWYSKSNTNYISYTNPEYDGIYEKLIIEFDLEKRKEYIVELQQLLLDDSVALVYGYYNYNLCSTSAIEGAYCPTSDFYWVTKDVKPTK
ncbi:ABC transporter substrate-binding protein [Alkalibaculum sp. M08DMB]|uniref:ABC transporter substrate-binding protein n=1 Tax=Alkalibaculum sporogenes TaxID=2655001 RepID=A0A6A7K9Q8_9FIRM|nr:ABC transporter substrate-binding protein [Alkalibaculum sporogenes]MPW26164.1 ABC transporter substrate-binding protein [Alkalibaculum sporogenes]